MPRRVPTPLHSAGQRVWDAGVTGQVGAMNTAPSTAPTAFRGASRRARRTASGPSPARYEGPGDQGHVPTSAGPVHGLPESPIATRSRMSPATGRSPAGVPAGGKASAAPSPPGTDRPGTRGVQLLSTAPDLVEAVEAVCIGAGVALTVTGDGAGARAASSDVVLVDAAWVGDAVPRGAVVVALADHADAWDTAARFGASAVVVLPHAAAWLADIISRSAGAELPRTTGRVYGVVGATGGVGASTVACWLADHFAARGTDTALVDGDPLGAGLDLALGEETADGLRWPELNQFSGTVAADQLWAAMPRLDALRYLSWDRRATHAQTVPMATVIAALRGAAAVQVVDLCRSDLERQAYWCDAVLVLAPRTVRGILAAEHTVRRCAPVPAVSAVCGVNVADVEPPVVAEAAGVPCVAAVAFDARVPQHLDDGTVLRRGRRTRHAKAVAQIARALEGLS